ncbi:MAG: fibronectin type III domain-containing protein [Nitrospinae bacterium]|nr:fibronectin type III domain-containing protein [Nitrospinota bacterium]
MKKLLALAFFLCFLAGVVAFADEETPPTPPPAPAEEKKEAPAGNNTEAPPPQTIEKPAAEAKPAVPEKPVVVLLPITMKGVSDMELSVFRDALAESLSAKYQVKYGEQTDKIIEEIFKSHAADSLESDESVSYKDVVATLDATLIGKATIFEKDGDYHISVIVYNVNENKAEVSRTANCEKCTTAELETKLKETASGVKIAPVAPEPPPAKAAKTNDTELTYWASIKESTNPEDFESYLQDFPKGSFTNLAKSRIVKLSKLNPKKVVSTVPPVIVHTPAKTAIDSTSFVLKAKITKETGVVASAFVYFRRGIQDFIKEPLVAGAGGQYEYKVPQEFMKRGKFEYYLEATDEAGNMARAGKASEPLITRIIQILPYSEGMVADRKRDGKDLTINVGTLAGVKKGDILFVIRADEKVIDPVTKEVLSVRQVLAGKIKVVSASERTSAARVEDEMKHETITPGMIVRARNDIVLNISGSTSQLRRVDLSWERSSEPEADGYVIYRSSEPDAGYKKIGQVKEPEITTYSDIDSKSNQLKDATVYYYRVVALNEAGGEGNVGESVAVTTKGGPEGPETISAVSGEIRQISFSWSQAHDTDVAGYILQMGSADKGAFTDVTTLKGADNVKYVAKKSKEVDLEDGKQYQFRLVPFNKLGTKGKPSRTVVASTHGKPEKPKPPRMEKAFVRSFTIAWDAHPDKGVVGYALYRKDPIAKEFKKIYEGNAKTLSYIDKGNHLQDGVSYLYAVSASIGGGIESPLSDGVETKTFGAPETPTGLTASEGKYREILLGWEPIKKEEITGYEIYKMDGTKAVSLTKISGKEKASYSDKSKLLDGKTYQYKIASFNVADVHSALSEAVQGATKPVPAKVQGLVGTSEEVKQTKLEWTANAEKDIKTYVVWKSAEEAKKGSTAGDTKTASFTAKNLDDGGAYYFRVGATDADGLESELSDPVKITTKPLPGAPGSLTATPTATSVALSWSASPASDVVKYNVYSQGMISGTLVGSTDSTTHEITQDIKPDSSYTFVVKAVDSTGLESKPSQPVKVKTPK